MSSLPLLAMLTDRLAPGVWRSDVRPQGLEQLAAGLGWRVVTVTTSNDKADLISAVSTGLGAPDYVRANWDSLADGLTDLEPPDSGRLLLVIDGARPTAHDAMLVDILTDTVDYWSPAGLSIQVLWLGPGQAPLLDEVDPIRGNRLGRTARTGRRPAR